MAKWKLRMPIHLVNGRITVKAARTIAFGAAFFQDDAKLYRLRKLCRIAPPGRRCFPRERD